MQTRTTDDKPVSRFLDAKSLRHGVALVLVFAFVLQGCCSVTPVTVSDHEDVESLNEALRDRPATVVFVDGDELAARDVQVGSDSTSYFDADEVRRSSVATSRVKAVRLTRRIAAGAAGAALGAVAGWVGPLLGHGLNKSDDPETEQLWESVGEWAVPVLAVSYGVGFAAAAGTEYQLMHSGSPM